MQFVARGKIMKKIYGNVVEKKVNYTKNENIKNKIGKERISLYPTVEEYDKLLLAYQRERRKRKRSGKKGRYTFSQFIIDSALKGISL